ncbi:hypothetical protein BN12_2620026 [Nostocoides japonicum T1-X7]|uniref:Uncharacterized protein n=1 Tax=Nostocoides japonicum T1-X7 TaxID=1194083 RepID=A0A077LX13_9MICO|nr:hypothetical protein [Tetrasphaera japonica]CCH78211.1 hypothetical protein BN12_2620026 [Tetrasphaera japonica T1-X7]
MSSALLNQLPTLSKYDPGESGEGSLDPLGLGALADRIADRLVPGMRARMSQPRFVTLSAVGAHACQPLGGLISSDGKTSFELAFEWLVVESLVQHPARDRLAGVPGSQKAQRARAAGERLSPANYLAGPRVFGFTGVYRPFSVDSRILDQNGLPGENAEGLLRAWEADQRLGGFQFGESGSLGANLRRNIEKSVRDSLTKGHSTAPLTGALVANVAKHLAPTEAGRHERGELRRLITSEQHPVRHELSRIMVAHLLRPDPWPTQRDLASVLLRHAAGSTTRAALRSATAYESCVTAIEYAFRRILQHGSSLQGGVFSVDQAAATPGIAELAPHVGNLVRRAVEATTELDEGLAMDVGSALGDVDRGFTAHEFVEALIARHQQVQAGKGKRMWIDEIKHGWWFVRSPYRRDWGVLDDEAWTHPMRIQTLLGFLARTA